MATTADLVWIRKRGVDHRVAGRSDQRTLCGSPLRGNELWLTKPVKKCQKCWESYRSAALAEMTDMMIEQMEVPPKFHSAFTFVKLKAKDFDGPTPWFPEFTDLFTDDEPLTREWSPSELPPPIDIRALVHDKDHPGSLVAFRLSAMDAVTIRGRVNPALPHPLLNSSWFLHDQFASSTIWGLAAPQRWVHISRGVSYKPAMDAEESAHIQLMLGAYQWGRTHWHVYLNNGGLGVNFPTTPTGVREIFRLRDIPEGRKRRAALRHWVTEHWRINVYNRDEEVLVRRQMRGAEKFSWSGLNGKITPSDEDFIALHEARIARVRARIDGTDHRLAREDP